MRELKFRAWDVESECYIDEKYWAGITPEGRNIWIVEEEEVSVLPILGEFIIEQYTGLKDKNGKEIYEGDILGGIWESGFISWCEKCKQLQYHCADIGCMACSGDVHWYEIVEDDGKLEVIGNIHENK